MLVTRIIAARRLPGVFVATRQMSSNTRPEGSVASSKGFGGREKAQEDEYARRHEAQLLKKLRDDIEAKKNELETREKKLAETEKKTETK